MDDWNEWVNEWMSLSERLHWQDGCECQACVVLCCIALTGRSTKPNQWRPFQPLCMTHNIMSMTQWKHEPWNLNVKLLKRVGAACILYKELFISCWHLCCIGHTGLNWHRWALMYNAPPDRSQSLFYFVPQDKGLIRRPCSAWKNMGELDLHNNKSIRDGGISPWHQEHNCP